MCPKCGDEGWSRERRLGGNDRCVNGHSYPSSTAVMTLDDVNFFIDIEVEGYTRQDELEGMSDFKINCLLTKLLGVALPDSMFDGTPFPDGTCMLGEIALWRDGDSVSTPDWYTPRQHIIVPDYCNNPEDIMPIAIENKLTLEPIANYNGSFNDKEWCCSIEDGSSIEAWSENPYRAICIVFILMKGAESEGSTNKITEDV